MEQFSSLTPATIQKHITKATEVSQALIESKASQIAADERELASLHTQQA
jgi:hypothetical protein